MILDIFSDVQGAMNIKRDAGGCACIYILPPSYQILEKVTADESENGIRMSRLSAAGQTAKMK